MRTWGRGTPYLKVVSNVCVIDLPFWHFHFCLGLYFMPNYILLMPSFYKPRFASNYILIPKIIEQT